MNFQEYVLDNKIARGNDVISFLGNNGTLVTQMNQK